MTEKINKLWLIKCIFIIIYMQTMNILLCTIYMDLQYHYACHTVDTFLQDITGNSETFACEFLGNPEKKCIHIIEKQMTVWTWSQQILS